MFKVYYICKYSFLRIGILYDITIHQDHFILNYKLINMKQDVFRNLKVWKGLPKHLLVGCLVTPFTVVAAFASASSDMPANEFQSTQQASNIHVTGTVVDENGEPVIGATVRVPNTKLATVTDVAGKFVLDTPPPVFFTSLLHWL